LWLFNCKFSLKLLSLLSNLILFSFKLEKIQVNFLYIDYLNIGSWRNILDQFFTCIIHWFYINLHSLFFLFFFIIRFSIKFNLNSLSDLLSQFVIFCNLFDFSISFLNLFEFFHLAKIFNLEHHFLALYWTNTSGFPGLIRQRGIINNYNRLLLEFLIILHNNSLSITWANRINKHSINWSINDGFIEAIDSGNIRIDHKGDFISKFRIGSSVAESQFKDCVSRCCWNCDLNRHGYSLSFFNFFTIVYRHKHFEFNIIATCLLNDEIWWPFICGIVHESHHNNKLRSTNIAKVINFLFDAVSW